MNGESVCNACESNQNLNDWKNFIELLSSKDVYKKLNSNVRTILDWKNFIENVLSSKDRQKIRLLENFTRDLKLDKNLSFERGTILPLIHWASKLGSIEIFEIVKLHFQRFDSEINTRYHPTGINEYENL